MKQHRKLYVLAVALLLALALFPGAAMAATPEEAEPAQTDPPLAPVYPAEVRASEGNGIHRLEKVYYLTTRDNPASIPTEDFDREGLHYKLLDVLKTDLTETDTKDFVEVITLESATKDVGEIIKTLEPELEVITEDGYTGTLKPDYTKISVEAAGYKTNSWTVSAKRTYPNLSDADVSLIPKTIEDSGRTLTLADVDWREANTDYVDGDALAVHYTAVASYTGTATGRSVTGYTVTVDYVGEVSKSSSDAIIYTAVFSAENTSHGETHLTAGDEDKNDAQRETAEEQEQGESAAKKIVFLILAALIALALIGYIGWRGYKYIRDKKRGYVL